LPVTGQGPQTHPESVERKFINESRLIHLRYAPMNVNFVKGSIDFIYLHYQKTWNGEASSERSEDDWIKSPWSTG